MVHTEILYDFLDLPRTEPLARSSGRNRCLGPCDFRDELFHWAMPSILCSHGAPIDLNQYGCS